MNIGLRGRGLETVTVVRYAEPERFGDLASEPISSIDYPNCAVFPADTGLEMQTFQQDVVTSKFTVIFPVGTDVLHTDQVVVRGVTYAIEGLPVLLMSPITGAQRGIQANTGTVSG